MESSQQITNKPKFRRKASRKTVHKRLEDKLKNLCQSGVDNYVYHYLVPGLSMSLQDVDVENMNIALTTQCSIPRSMYVAPFINEKLDICHRRVQYTHSFNTRISMNAKAFENYAKQKHYRKAMKNGTYPLAVIRAMHLINVNRYPCFNGQYDWCFTGGNLAISKGFLITAAGENMNAINISSVKAKRMKLIASKEYSKGEDNAPTSEILEIQASTDVKNSFTIRCEKNITKFFYDGSEIICEYNICNKNVPFITFCEDPFNENSLLTGDLNRQVLLWDINNSTTTPNSKLLTQNDDIHQRADNWNRIQHFKDNSFVFTDFEKFGLIDKRIETSADKMDFSRFEEEIGDCEKIASMVVSKKYKNIIYVGTSHKLYAVDARYLKKKTDTLILLKWFHQMKYPPLILKSFACENIEIVAASSPLNGEIQLFEVNKTLNDNKKSVYISPHLSTSVPNLLQSYYVAKLQGECLSPLVSIESRIRRCTIGMDFFEKNNKLQLFMANSIGDIFASKVTIDEEIEYTKKYNVDVVQTYYNAVEAVTEKATKKLFATDVKDLSSLKKILRCKKLSSNEDFTKFQNNRSYIESENIREDGSKSSAYNDFPMKKKKHYKWEKTPEQYAKCKDVLAPGLFAAWNFEYDENDDNEFKKLRLLEAKDYIKDKVHNWIGDIQMNYYKDNRFCGEPLDHDDHPNLQTSLNQQSKNNEQNSRNHNESTESAAMNQTQRSAILTDRNEEDMSAPSKNYRSNVQKENLVVASNSISDKQEDFTTIAKLTKLNSVDLFSQFEDDAVNTIIHNTLDDSKHLEINDSMGNITHDSKRRKIAEKKPRKQYIKGF